MKLTVCSVALIVASTAPAADLAISAKDAQMIAKSTVSAAHPTGERPALLKHALSKDEDRENRYTLTLRAEYYGALSGKRYVADIEIKFDTAGTKLEVLEIDYSDNNFIPANEGNLRSLKRTFNERLKK